MPRKGRKGSKAKAASISINSRNLDLQLASMMATTLGPARGPEMCEPSAPGSKYAAYNLPNLSALRSAGIKGFRDVNMTKFTKEFLGNHVSQLPAGSAPDYETAILAMCGVNIRSIPVPDGCNKAKDGTKSSTGLANSPTQDVNQASASPRGAQGTVPTDNDTKVQTEPKAAEASHKHKPISPPHTAPNHWGPAPPPGTKTPSAVWRNKGNVHYKAFIAGGTKMSYEDKVSTLNSAIDCYTAARSTAQNSAELASASKNLGMAGFRVLSTLRGKGRPVLLLYNLINLGLTGFNEAMSNGRDPKWLADVNFNMHDFCFYAVQAILKECSGEEAADLLFPFTLGQKEPDFLAVVYLGMAKNLMIAGFEALEEGLADKSAELTSQCTFGLLEAEKYFTPEDDGYLDIVHLKDKSVVLTTLVGIIKVHQAEIVLFREQVRSKQHEQIDVFLKWVYKNHPPRNKEHVQGLPKKSSPWGKSTIRQAMMRAMLDYDPDAVPKDNIGSDIMWRIKSKFLEQILRERRQTLDL